MNKSESIAALAKSLADFQGEVKQPLKDKANPFFKSKYVPLENVVEAIAESAPKHGLSFLQYPVNQENKVGIVTLLMHSSGEWIETEPIFAKPGKDDAQATGSVITYLKRYSLSAVFGITSDEDDDGNSASQQPKQTSKPAQQPSNKLTVTQKDTIVNKANKIAAKSGVEMKDVWTTVQGHFNFDKSLVQLTNTEASKVIEYLISQE